MKKLIGGLIVISLLSKPAILNASTFESSYLAYKVFKDKNENRIIFVISRDDECEEEDIDDLLGEIESETRMITNLIKEKNRLVERIDTCMYLHSHTKTALDEEQISSFAAFCAYHNEESRQLQENLQKIEQKKNLADVKKELLNKDSDYEMVYDKLKTVSIYQSCVIANLSNIINAGNSVLEQIYPLTKPNACDNVI